MSQIRDHWKAFVIIIAVILLAAFYTWSVMSDRNKQDSLDSPAMQSLSINGEELPYTDLKGNPASLDELIGEIIIVNSWASWSPASSRELKVLANIAKEYKNKNVKILAINRSEPANTAQRYLESINVADDITLVLDPSDKYYKSVDGYNMPETIVYDREGNIEEHIRGELNAEMIKMYVDKILKSESIN